MAPAMASSKIGPALSGSPSELRTTSPRKRLAWVRVQGSGPPMARARSRVDLACWNSPSQYRASPALERILASRLAHPSSGPARASARSYKSIAVRDSIRHRARSPALARAFTARSARERSCGWRSNEARAACSRRKAIACG